MYSIEYTVFQVKLLAIDRTGNKVHYVLGERAGLIAEQVLDLAELFVYVGTIADHYAVLAVALEVPIEDHVFGAKEAGHLEAHIQRDRYEKIEEHEKVQKVVNK